MPDSLKKRKLCIAVISYILGIYLGRQFGFLTCLMFIFIVFCAILIKLIINRKSVRSLLIICAAAATAGILACSSAYDAIDKKISELDGKKGIISGKIISEAVDYPNSKLYELKLLSFSSGGESFDENLKVMFYADKEDDFAYGDIVRFEGTIKKVSAITNTGVFDYAEYMKTNNIYLRVYPSGRAQVLDNSVNHYSPTEVASLLNMKLSGIADRYLSEDTRGLFKGIILGNKSDISDEIKEGFALSGISHILAVSGQNVGIIVMVMMFMLSFCTNRGRAARIFYILAISAFVLIAGASASIVRAGIMCILYNLAFILNREDDPYTSLAAACGIILLINPLSLFNIGFQMSSLATLFLLLFAKPIQERLKMLPSKAATEILAMTIAAQLGTLVIIANNFHRLSLISIVANVIVNPILPFVLFAGTLLFTFSPVPLLAYIFAGFIDFLLRIIVFIAMSLSHVPFAAVDLPSFDAGHTVIYILAVAVLYKLLKKEYGRHLLLLSSALLAFVIAVFTFSVYNALFKINVNFINVGQGDSSLITAPVGKTVMVDGGGSEYLDIGERVIGPFLTSKGIKKVDLAFVSHFHADHSDGINWLIKNNKLKVLAVPKGAEDYETLDLAKAHGVEIIYLKEGDVVSVGDTLKFYILYAGSGEDNDSSMLIKADCYGSTILFTGDFSEDMLEKFCDCGYNLSSTILKVPHHGSKTSMSKRFVERVSPRYAVISCGNEKYFPSDEMLNTPQGDITSTYRTDINGTISFSISKSGLDIKTQK